MALLLNVVLFRYEFNDVNFLSWVDEQRNYV